ncbi:hypothetical protein HPT25_28150 [Bacillus sp. BRMEA1]|uniref:hypothetical protein n=1 Tax=Neobacillus endophyticus TaxID=2738405 RepID=UPI001566BBB6|nr:hypothetical protein [Neobacillus endophyticus]NRD81168.1 hypothetical protein [Neobacillus endophyticus]
MRPVRIKTLVKSKQVTANQVDFHSEMLKVNQKFVDEGLMTEWEPLPCSDIHSMCSMIKGYQYEFFDESGQKIKS